MSVRVVNKNDLLSDPLHDKTFLDWVVEQTERISEMSNVITMIKEDSTERRGVSPSKINECAARFVEFYTKNIAFISIYEELADENNKAVNELYDFIYLDIKADCANHEKGIGIKYKKKEATEKEIKMEMRGHKSFQDYKSLKLKSEEYEKKARTQEKFIKSLGKLDSILSLLQRSMTAEMKYLYIET